MTTATKEFRIETMTVAQELTAAAKLVIEKGKQVRRKKLDWMLSKEETADKKKDYESAQEELLSLSLKLEPESMPLFDRPADQEIVEAPESACANGHYWRTDEDNKSGYFAECVRERCLAVGEECTTCQGDLFNAAGEKCSHCKGVGVIEILPIDAEILTGSFPPEDEVEVSSREEINEAFAPDAAKPVVEPDDSAVFVIKSRKGVLKGFVEAPNLKAATLYSKDTFGVGAVIEVDDGQATRSPGYSVAECDKEGRLIGTVKPDLFTAKKKPWSSNRRPKPEAMV